MVSSRYVHSSGVEVAIRKRMKVAVKGLVKQSARTVLDVLDADPGEQNDSLSSRDVGLDVVVRPSDATVASVSSPVEAREDDEPTHETSISDSVVDDGMKLDGAPAAPETSSTADAPPELTESQRETIRESVAAMCQTVHDPEIPVNIYELGLIYDIDVSVHGHVDVRMTLTSPNCPAAQVLPSEVETKSNSVEHVRSVAVELVWDPPWEPSMMSEAAQLELNMF